MCKATACLLSFIEVVVFFPNPIYLKYLSKHVLMISSSSQRTSWYKILIIGIPPISPHVFIASSS
jgi:hypothetical protein